MTTETDAVLGTTWIVDLERSTVGFTIAHLGVATVTGRFGSFAGTLTPDHASGTVDPATIDTGNTIRDRRLRSPEFFDIGRRPRIRFSARRVEHLGADGLRITGDLTIKDATRQLELSGRILAATADRLELLLTGELNRTDFGIESLELSAAGVSKRVKVRATLSLAH